MKLKSASAIEELALKQREAFALELFNYEKVSEDITAAAAQGIGYIRVMQELPINLNNTHAATQLVKRLKEAKFRVEWVDTALAERSNGKETGAFITYRELRIFWMNVHIYSGPQSDPA